MKNLHVAVAQHIYGLRDPFAEKKKLQAAEVLSEITEALNPFYKENEISFENEGHGYVVIDGLRYSITVRREE